MRALALCAVVAGCGATARPSKPTAQTLLFAFVTVGRHAGDGEVRIDGSTRHEHFTFNDRGRGPDVTSVVKLDATGAPIVYRATGHDYLKAPVDETLTDTGGALAWRSSGEHGSAPRGWFVPLSAPLDVDALLAQSLLRANRHRVDLLPAGRAWIDDDQTLDVAGHKLRRIAIAGLGFAPTLVWLDDNDELFGEVSRWTSIIRAGSEDLIGKLVELDEQWQATRAAKLVKQLEHEPPAAGIAIIHARMFDSETKTIVPDSTVIVANDVITAVGDAHTPIPPGTVVIDAHGKTLLPGLWDMHVHLGDGDGILDLASGVTVVRDLGNDPDSLVARTKRFDDRTELGPRVLRAGLIDGPGPLAAPTGVLVATRDEAIAAVQKYVDKDYAQIKIYSSVKPELVPVIAEAAHAHHLRVSGHIPTGMNAAEAVLAGYDEIQHVNFLFLRFLAKPTDDTRTPLRFTQVAEHAAELDLAGADVTAFLDLLVHHDTVLDPTLTAFHDMFVDDPGDLDPMLAPYAARLPAQIVRGARAGGLPAPDGKRAIFRASFAALGKLVKLAWDRHIRIVAGTDGLAGLSLSHELELYVAAGIPAPDVLQLATLGAARVMGFGNETGSIRVNNRADLVLVDGDPTRDITALRKTEVVICRGIAYYPAELFAAVGMGPR